MKFPSEVFPPPMKAVIDGLGPVVGSRPEFGGLSALFVGSILSARVKVKVKSGWSIDTNIYTAIVANKGEAKSPAIKFLGGPMFEYFGKLSASYLKDSDTWDAKMKAAGSLPKGAKGAAMKELEANKPVFPWWGIVTDATVEGLRNVGRENHESGHPNRIGRYNDELDGWISSMDQYKEGGDMAFYLQAHDGDLHIKANKGEKSASPPMTLSLIGTIQPEIFSKAFNGDNTHNGLLDRILIAATNGPKWDVDPFAEWLPGVLSSYRKYVLNILEDLPEMDLDFPEDCRDVAREFIEWAEKVDARAGCGASPKWKQHFFKVVGILTVLWELDSITVETCERSMELTKFMVGCWVRSFRIMNRSDVSKAEDKILIIMKQKGDGMTISEATKIFASKDRTMAKQAIESIIEDGRVTASEAIASNGRKTTILKLSLEGEVSA